MVGISGGDVTNVLRPRTANFIRNQGEIESKIGGDHLSRRGSWVNSNCFSLLWLIFPVTFLSTYPTQTNRDWAVEGRADSFMMKGPRSSWGKVTWKGEAGCVNKAGGQLRGNSLPGFRRCRSMSMSYPLMSVLMYVCSTSVEVYMCGCLCVCVCQECKVRAEESAGRCQWGQRGRKSGRQ